MSYRRSLPGGMRRMPRGTGQIPCSGVGLEGCRARLRHRDLAPHPGSRLPDCLARSRIGGLHRLKQRQHVLRAVGCPRSEKPMVTVLQRAAAANRDESGVAIFGKDHSCRPPLAPSAQQRLDSLRKHQTQTPFFCKVRYHEPDSASWTDCLSAREAAQQADLPAGNRPRMRLWLLNRKGGAHHATPNLPPRVDYRQAAPGQEVTTRQGSAGASVSPRRGRQPSSAPLAVSPIGRANQTVTLPQMRAATGLSITMCASIRRGYVPHPRHWPALRDCGAVSCDAPFESRAIESTQAR